MRIVKFLYRILVLLCLLLSVLLCLSATVWMKVIAALTVPTIEQLQKISELFFSPSKISLYRILATLPLLLAVVLIWKRNFLLTQFYFYSSVVFSYTKHVWRKQWLILKEERNWIGLLLMLAWILFVLYPQAQKFPFTVDEAFSWVHLVNKGPFVSALYYPAPNNHIFYTIVCSLCNYLPLDPIWVMRIPTVLAYLLCIYFVFLIAHRLQYKKYIVGIGALFALQPSVLYYALHGRGYLFLVLFALLSAWFLYSALVNNVKPAYAGFVISAILGFYTIPVFLYWFVFLGFSSLVFVVYAKSGDRIKQLLWSYAWVILGTGLLYAPVLLLNGLDALVNNGWVQPKSYSLPEVGHYTLEVFSTITGFEGLYLLIPLVLMLGAMISFYIENKSSAWCILVTLFFIPVLALMLWVQQLLPFERIWIPFTLLWIAWMIWFIDWLAEKVLQALGVVLYGILVVVSINNIGAHFGKGDPYYEQLHAFVKMVDPAQVRTVYSGDDAYLVMLQVKFAQAHQEAEFTAVNDLHGQTADLRIIPINALDQEAISVDEERFYANAYMVAYRRKGLQILR